jgi:RNA polymerase sigma-70 factor (ECF subfamily)
MIESSLQIAFQEHSLTKEQEAAACDDPMARLVKRHARFVFRVAYSVLRNVHDAEDVVQETFLRVHRARRWESMVDEKAFLARAAWRIAVDRLPKARAAVLDFDVPSAGQDPEQAAIQADWNATIHRLIDALPHDLRQPLALSTVEELNSHEISQVMRIPEGTVRTRLMRARQVLKQKLGALMEGQHGE